MEFIKYPKTYHIHGSKLEPCGLTKAERKELNKTNLDLVEGDFLVLEEKMDGSQLGLSFVRRGDIQFQSRGTILSGGEREFSLAKNWAYEHIDELWALLGTRFVLFGEWLFHKHTIFY
ncbi:MAG: RNA ligase family protein, partial [Pseudomonadales bacterium]|nr:RNA ligase family protein [Pseudomonadales bacterium]